MSPAMRQPQFRLRSLVLIVMATGTLFGLVANVSRFGVPEIVYLLAFLLFLLFVCSLPVLLSLMAAHISLRDLRRGIGGSEAKGRWRPGGPLVEVPDSAPGQAIELEILRMVARSPLPLSPQVISFRLRGVAAPAKVREAIRALTERKLVRNDRRPERVTGAYRATTAGQELLRQKGCFQAPRLGIWH